MKTRQLRGKYRGKNGCVLLRYDEKLCMWVGRVAGDRSTKEAWAFFDYRERIFAFGRPDKDRASYHETLDESFFKGNTVLKTYMDVVMYSNDGVSYVVAARLILAQCVPLFANGWPSERLEMHRRWTSIEINVDGGSR